MAEPLRFIAIGMRGFCPAKVVLWWASEDTVTLVFDGHNLSETYTGRDRLLLLGWLSAQSEVLR
jgi:hypothetical protein